MRPTIFVPLFVLLVLCIVPLFLGLGLILSPYQVGNLLSDAFVIFPPVERADSPQRWYYRAFGLAIIAVWASALHHMYVSALLPLIDALRR
jgi:hypothetical protein